jgi:hypothetical protein
MVSFLAWVSGSLIFLINVIRRLAHLRDESSCYRKKSPFIEITSLVEMTIRDPDPINDGRVVANEVANMGPRIQFSGPFLLQLGVRRHRIC